MKLAEHWGQSLADTCFGRKLEMFIRSDRKGNINWDKAPVYTWAEILKERERRRVVFTVDPEIFELP